MYRLVVMTVLIAACTPQQASPEPGSAVTTSSTSTTASVVDIPTTSTATTAPSTTAPPDPHARPEWLGTRPLPLRDDGFGQVLPTPPELEDRAFATPDVLPPPEEGAELAGSWIPAPPEVLARSTWHPDCPVSSEQLAYVTVSHWGFDDRYHTGELLVSIAHADAIISVFTVLAEARFPIEEMRIIRPDELDLPPTGDGNVTTAFVCRPVVGSSSWSMHAYGEAIDINPFHNPYVRGDLVLPELATTYADRTNLRPGMIAEGNVVVAAFDSIGWEWGGRWTSLSDPMHFSTTGR